MFEQPSPPAKAEFKPLSVEDLVKFVIAGNPLYLVSAALALYASTILFDTGNIWVESAVPVMILAGFSLLSAATAVFIVRRGKVWDDARSLAFIILIFLLTLSASLDDKLVDRPEVGGAWLLASLLLAVGVTEWLRRGLGIRLSRGLWANYYGLLGVFFIYPFLLARLLDGNFSEYSPVVRGTLLFPVVFSLGLLPLLVSIAKGHFLDRDNGTPWRYLTPVIFVILTGAAVLRSFLITISFYGGRGQGGYGNLEHGFAYWMLLPFLVVVGMAVIELCIAAKRPGRAAAFLVLAAFLALAFASFEPESGGRVQRVFYYAAWGRACGGWIPPLAALTILYGYAVCRKLWWAVPFAAMAAGLLALQFWKFSGAGGHHLLAVFLTATFIFFALWKRHWWTLLLLLLWVILAGGGYLLFYCKLLDTFLLPAGLAATAILVVGVRSGRRELEAAGLAMNLLFFFFCTVMYKCDNWEACLTAALLYLGTLWRLFRYPVFAIIETVIVLIGLCILGIRWTDRFEWRGVGVIVGSLFFFAAAFAVSLAKAGLLKKWLDPFYARFKKPDDKDAG